MSTWSPGNTNPATPRGHVHGNRDGAHAGAERRGEEAAILRSDERTASDRLAGGDRIAHDGAEKLLGIAVGLALDVISALHELFRPRLEREALRVDDRACRKRLLGDEHLRPHLDDRCGSCLLRAGTGEHVLSHHGRDHRNDQRSNEQRELSSHPWRDRLPQTGHLNSLTNQTNWLRNRWVRIARAPKAIATPYGISGRPSRRLSAVPANNAEREHAAGEGHEDKKFHGPAGREP